MGVADSTRTLQGRNARAPNRPHVTYPQEKMKSQVFAPVLNFNFSRRIEDEFSNPFTLEEVETTTCLLAGLSTLSECSEVSQTVEADFETSDFDPYLRSRTPCVSESDDSCVSFDSETVEGNWSTEGTPSRCLKALREYLAREDEPLHGFLDRVQERSLTPNMRLQELTWLAQLIKFHECDDNVFCYAAMLMDKLLSVTKTKEKLLRIVAVSCFVLASKTLLEERDQPLHDDLVANCEKSFSTSDLKRMQLIILDKLRWELPARSPACVLEDLLLVVGVDIGLSEMFLTSLLPTLTAKFAALFYSYELQRYKASTLAGALLVHELKGATGTPEGMLLRSVAMVLGLPTNDLEAISNMIARHLRAVASLIA